MNFTEVCQKLIDDITFVIDSRIKNIERDRTFKAKIIEKVSVNKYKILYKNRYYTARCRAELNFGDIVYVCAPENNWSELFINLPCSRAEFEAVESQCTKSINNLQSQINQQNIDLAVSSPVNVNDQNSVVRKCGRIGIYSLRTFDITIPAIWEAVNLGTIPDGYRPMYEAAYTISAPSGTRLILRIGTSGVISLQTVSAKNDTTSGYLHC